MIQHTRSQLQCVSARTQI